MATNNEAQVQDIEIRLSENFRAVMLQEVLTPRFLNFSFLYQWRHFIAANIQKTDLASRAREDRVSVAIII